jgi:uncharacterized membrane protein YsdA (DUF1294 family)
MGIHLVSTWAGELGMVLGQMKTKEKCQKQEFSPNRKRLYASHNKLRAKFSCS